jgi:hypothetical protein
MTTIVYYLEEVLDQLIEKAIAVKKEDLQSEFDEGILWGYYFALRKLLDIATVLDFINYLPKKLQDFDPASLVKDLSKGNMTAMQTIENAVKASLEGAHEESYLRVVLEQLITDAIDFRESVETKNDFDDGKSFAYYCTILTLLNQAEGFGLSDNLPEVLRNFIPEQLGFIKKSDLGL